MMNSSLFLQNINNLFTLMSRHLAHLIRVFEWEHKNCFAGMMSKFLLPEVNEEFGKEDYEDLNKLLVENIVWLQRQPGLGVSIGMEKLLQYYQIVLEILRGSGQ